MAKALEKNPGDLNFEPFEARAAAQGFRFVAGVDEVGRGPLAGPVVAAAVILPSEICLPGIKDSKLLSPRQREQLAPMIQHHAVSWAIGVVDVAEIDRLNILRASLRAMMQAFQALSPLPDYLLIDGNQRITDEPASGSEAHHMPMQETIVKGDQLCLSIAAASIIAKVARDRMMVEFDHRYPQYGFAAHKGYGSASHLAALEKFGPCPIHRLTFRPVREVTEKFSGGTVLALAEKSAS